MTQYHKLVFYKQKTFYFFLTVPESEKFKNKATTDLVSRQTYSWFIDGDFPLHPHMTEGARELSEVSFIKPFISHNLVTSQRP